MAKSKRKPCKSNQRRNSKTGRCRKISRRRCSPGTRRSGSKCIPSILKPVSALSPCRAGFVRRTSPPRRCLKSSSPTYAAQAATYTSPSSTYTSSYRPTYAPQSTSTTGTSSSYRKTYAPSSGSSTSSYAPSYTSWTTSSRASSASPIRLGSVSRSPSRVSFRLKPDSILRQAEYGKDRLDPTPRQPPVPPSVQYGRVVRKNMSTFDRNIMASQVPLRAAPQAPEVVDISMPAIIP